MENEWIDVNERLPTIDESTKYVLGSYSKEVVVLSNGHPYFSKYVFDHYGDRIGWMSINASSINITHWLELPPTPPNK